MQWTQECEPASQWSPPSPFNSGGDAFLRPLATVMGGPVLFSRSQNSFAYEWLGSLRQPSESASGSAERVAARRENFGPALVVHPSLHQLYAIQSDEIARMATVHELRPKTPDSEKITVNLGFIDLGRVDLMVRDGFYANRADFIRTAIRNQLERHDDAVRQSVARRQLQLGLSHYTRQDLEAARDAGTPLLIQVLGLAAIASDVTPELARAAIASVQVLGAFQASPAVKAALADRTT
jgi:Arc/MetJ-type ribon-helix-helix transcriptional regulator